MQISTRVGVVHTIIIPFQFVAERVAFPAAQQSKSKLASKTRASGDLFGSNMGKTRLITSKFGRSISDLNLGRNAV